MKPLTATCLCQTHPFRMLLGLLLMPVCSADSAGSKAANTASLHVPAVTTRQFCSEFKQRNTIKRGA
jgi:hypothetical protein